MIIIYNLGVQCMKRRCMNTARVCHRVFKLYIKCTATTGLENTVMNLETIL